MEHSNEIKTYLAYKCTEIPNTEFNSIMVELLEDAAFKMDTQIPGDTREFIRQLLWLISKKYQHLPLNKLIEAIHKGAMGELGGTIKLSLRNINIWLKEINEAWAMGAIARSNHDRMIETDIDDSEIADPDSAACYALRMNWGLGKRITRQEWDFLGTQHDKMVAKVKEGTPAENLHPGMFLSGFEEPEHYTEEDFIKAMENKFTNQK
ncbi:hypothetical protein KAR91_46220 [Candidatus Pacearchaeota archaeon]|nr:hypothetical protein [Candidatus Pacearchaeota archaeon]